MCRVLRCQNPSAHVVNLTKGYPEMPKAEVPVCEEHHRQIEAGEPYHLDVEQWVLLMGDDIRAADLRLITAVDHVREDQGIAARHANEFHVEYEDGSPGIVLLSDEALRSLRKLLEMFPDIGGAS